MSKHTPIDAELMKRLFEYKNGQLIRKTATSSNVKIGDVAGTLNDSGYFSVKVDGKCFKVSRIIYAMHYDDPAGKQIDHINQNPKDNRIENLRVVNHQENHRNRTKNSNNTSGITGVYWIESRQKWQVAITVDGKQIHCGHFTHLRAAAVERKYQEIRYGFHEKHGA